MFNTEEISKLFNQIDKNSEFEVMFNNYSKTNKLSMISFVNLLKYAKYLNKQEGYDIYETTSLDINYGKTPDHSIRITINGIDEINKYMNVLHQRNNSLIFSTLCTQHSSSDKLTFIHKYKNQKNIIDYDEYDIRFRMSKEIPLTEKELDTFLDFDFESSNILYRYKQRVSLIFFNNNDGRLSLDITIVKNSKTPDEIKNGIKEFEVEIDYTLKNKVNKATLDTILEKIYLIKKVLINSTEIISKSETNKVIKEYKTLIYDIHKDYNNLYSMQPISTEIAHFMQIIPNNYSVTEKTDGDKYQILVYNNTLYLISNNLNVMKTTYKSTKLNNSIFEGELLNINNTYLFMIYDCLVFKKENIRNIVSLEKRLEYVFELVKEFNPKFKDFAQYDGQFDIDNIRSHYSKEVNNFYKNLNKQLSISKKNDIIFYKKMFLFPTGGSDSEVFIYSDVIWKHCNDLQTNNCPYLVDGIIYTAINQIYTRDRRDQKFPIYKYKPPLTNSIDVYIKFKFNIETNEYLEIFDNTIESFELNKTFRIAELYVGDSIGGKEIPTPFMKEVDNHEAFFPLDRGEVRDTDGNLVNNETVVELIYINDISIPHKYRWKILRTRWDKTESVIRYNQRYGNFKDNAIKIWNSMKESVTPDEIYNLSFPSTYNSQRNQLLYKMSATTVMNHKYYQKITSLGHIFRNFHNWIKSCIIYNYCSDSKNKKSVLDIGCGRGGDIEKWYHARVSKCVGIDPDYNGLYGSMDSATSRYNSISKGYPQFPPMIWIQGDARYKLDVEYQEKIIPKMTNEIKEMYKNHLKNNKFDIISYQMSIHYMFQSKDSINNIADINNTFLNTGGYVLCTLMDSVKVMKLLNGKDIYTSYYTNDEGYKKTFFEINKRFKGSVQNVPGQNIDIHMSWISQDGVYLTEYLVTRDLLVSTMNSTGCVLVDENNFSDIYIYYREWFTNAIEYEANDKNKTFYNKIAAFYKELKGSDLQSKIWSSLFKLYVFKKI